MNTHHTLHTAFRLLETTNQLWDDVSDSPTLRKPTVLQLPLNDICNSRCQMCDIWKQKGRTGLETATLRSVLSSELFDAITDVGINGGEPTLRPDLPEVCAVLASTLPALKSVHLITNALRPPLIRRAIPEMARVLSLHGVRLNVMVSLDGVGETHDVVRGRSGNFAAALEVLDYLATQPGLGTINAGCTLIRDNAYGGHALLDFCIARDLPVRFRLGVPHPRLYSLDQRDAFALRPDETYEICGLLTRLIHDYEREPLRNAFYRSLLRQLAYGEARTAGCPWRNHGATLTADGSLAYCAVASPSLGDATTADPSRLYFDNEPVLEAIRANSCADCRHDYYGFGTRNDVLLHAVAPRLPKVVKRVAGPIMRRARRIVNKGTELTTVLPLRRPQERRPPSARPHVLLCGWYGTETLGDKAIVAAVTNLLHAAIPQADVTIASLEPWVTEFTKAQLPELANVNVVSISDALRLASSGAYDAVLVAGGPMMAPVDQVVDIARLLQRAHQVGARTGAIGIGVGPLGTPLRNRTLATLLNSCELLVVRDRASNVLSRKLGVSNNVQEGLDPALVWIADQVQTTAVPRSDEVLFAVRQMPWSEYAPDVTVDEQLHYELRFADEIVRCIRTLESNRPGLAPIGFPMHRFHVGGDDRRYMASLSANIGASSWLTANKHVAPAADLARFRSATGVVAMRFHSQVFALAVGAPLAAIDYTHGGKSAALFKEIGCEDLVQSYRTFDGERAANLILESTVATAKTRSAALLERANTFRNTMIQEIQELMR